MTLREAQSLFAKLIGQTISWICGHDGWELTFGDFNRPDRLGHMENSLHYVRLAADMNLFVNGSWIQHDSEEWEAIGSYWTALHPMCRWGGHFKQGDLNHFSMEWEGRA